MWYRTHRGGSAFITQAILFFFSVKGRYRNSLQSIWVNVVNIPEGRKINDSSFVFEPAMPVSGLGMQSVRLVTTLIQHIDVVVGVYLAPRRFRRVVRIVEDSALPLDSDPKEV